MWLSCRLSLKLLIEQTTITIKYIRVERFTCRGYTRLFYFRLYLILSISSINQIRNCCRSVLTFSVIVYVPLSSCFSHSTSSRKDTIIKTKRLSLSKSSINVCMLSPIVILFRMYLADARPDKSLLTISRSVGSPLYSLVLRCFLSARNTNTLSDFRGIVKICFFSNQYLFGIY